MSSPLENEETKVSEYFSQFGEDKILAEFFQNQRTGICVEVGAYDGVEGSNTYFFEKRGWKCFLVEPHPVLIEKIKSRRQSTVIPFAASAQKGELEFFIAENVETLSSLDNSNTFVERVKDAGGTIKSVKVKTAPLDELLLEQGITQIDFITIDVEGHEGQVLSGFTLSKFCPRIVILEDNSNGTDTSLDERLAQEGYQLFLRTGCNDWYSADKELLAKYSEQSRELKEWKEKNKKIWKARNSALGGLLRIIFPTKVKAWLKSKVMG